MISPFTFTSTCSMISARVGTTLDAARTIAAAKSCFFISFNILAYLNTFAQVAKKARNPAENAPFRPGVFLGRAKDLVPAEPRRDLPGRRPGRPPRGFRGRAGEARPAGLPFRPDSHVEPKCRGGRQLDGFPLLHDLGGPGRSQPPLLPELQV